MDSALAGLVDNCTRTVVSARCWPTPAPYDGQSRGQWAAHVARLREQQNAAALEAVRLLDNGEPRAEVSTVRYQDIPVGDAVITARVYTPFGHRTCPAIAVLHGGGWWMGGGATGFHINDGLCRALCAHLGAVVLNVDYRLAPEHPYPAPLNDVYQTLNWIAGNADALRVDAGRLAVLGISSGGNLAAAAALMARDRGGPPLRAQLLITPALDATASSPSIRQEPATLAEKQMVRQLYTYGQSDLRHPYLSPLHAPNLEGLPPAAVIVGTFDPLRDDGRSYAVRLRAAGVAATLREYPMTHTIALPEVRARWRQELIDTAAGLL